MKKLSILLLILCSGCSCLIGQIPPQYIFAGAGCEAPLPDYLPMVHASDNCVLASLVQTPLPGFMLGPTNMIANVVIKATDASGNSSQITFNVMIIDTIPPIITADDTLLSADYDKMDALYRQADRIVKDKVLNADALFPYAEIGITTWPDSVFYLVREIRLKDDLPTKMYMWQK